MEVLNDMMSPLADWLRGNLGEIAMVIVATLLVLYGSLINDMVRNAVSKFHFVVRVSVFMALCAFGFGAITTWLAPWIRQALDMLPDLWLPLTILGIFVLLGILVEKKKP